jgi:hypothetical protein
MSENENMGTAQGPARKPGDPSEQLDNPPLWSPWNFQPDSVIGMKLFMTKWVPVV